MYLFIILSTWRILRMFYGREIERKKLCTMFQTDGQMISLIYGRRRIGKSELIKQVLKETEIKSISTSELELKLRYAPNEKFFQTQWNRFPVSLDAPVFSLTHTMAAITVPDSITIRSGYSANAEIELQRANNALTVPESAIEYARPAHLHGV